MRPAKQIVKADQAGFDQKAHQGEAPNRGDGPGDALPAAAMIARALYEERRRRDQFFKASLFAEPAWDMLLDLRIQVEATRAPSVSSVCIGSGAPPSTALRYLQALESEGLVERWMDPADARRKLTRLSPAGAERLDAYLLGIGLNRANPLP